MIRQMLSSLVFCLSFLQPAFSLTVSIENAQKIGEKIWNNECAGSVEGLTHWKKGENFPSLGIGHFIWYPEGKRERFEETFPELLQFLQKQDVSLPAWLKSAKGCPWYSRDEFYRHIQSPEMKSLRQLLLNTRSLQAIFIANRLELSFAQIQEKCPQKERDRITALFLRLANEANGLYALIDYLNFKGAGISSAETYQGQGWGLLQVLQGIPEHSETPLVDFVRSAKSVLQHRVDHSPPERQEARWLQGWLNRVDTYLSFAP